MTEPHNARGTAGGLPIRYCQGCGVMPATVTHLCPPPQGTIIITYNACDPCRVGDHLDCRGSCGCAYCEDMRDDS